MKGGKWHNVTVALLAKSGDDLRSRCHYCDCAFGYGPRRRTVDHLVPVSRGGKNTPANRVMACHRCNVEKSSMNEGEYRAWLEAANGLTGRRRKASRLAAIRASTAAYERRRVIRDRSIREAMLGRSA